MGTRSPRWFVAHLPNALTAARLAIALAFPLLGPGVRLPALIFAAVSDALDGYIARRFGAMSWTGALLDAAADKVLAIMVLATFTYEGLVEVWQLPLLLARDIAVGIIYLYIVMIRRWDAFRHVKARTAGKLTTVFVFSYVIAVLAWPAAAALLFWPAAAISVAAAVDYLVVFQRAHREHVAEPQKRKTQNAKRK
jgi:phosphatidylglycerophosphate synthase